MSERRRSRSTPEEANPRRAGSGKPGAVRAASDDSAAGAAARSRRDFLRLLAVGSIAAVTGAAAAPRRARAATTTKRSAGAVPPPSAAVRKEIQSQKDYLARTLKVIREYPLDTGSPMAFEFRPLRAARAARGPRKEKKS